MRARFPTCNHRADHCELDHALARNYGGTTKDANLHALCARHHHAKHEGGWTLTRHTDDSTEWTSPSRHRYVKPAETLPVDITRQHFGDVVGLDDDVGPPGY